MGINFNIKNTSTCGDCGSQCGNNCSSGCPDFTIRRYDTRPSFKVSVEDCDGPMDLDGLVVEASMWATAKLRDKLDADDVTFRLADNIGFAQAMIGDIILFDHPRQPEYLLVTGFDEEKNFIQVQRGYRGTTARAWKRGTKLRIFRFLNAPVSIELHIDDVSHPDGTTERDVLQAAYMVYDWNVGDTCLGGCYWLEFKLIKMLDLVLFLPGGIWAGPVIQNDNGIYYTGSIVTDSSVKLSYDSVNDRFLLPEDAWQDASHLHSTNYFTGTEHNDGSVFLSRTRIGNDDNAFYGGSFVLDATNSVRALAMPSDVSVADDVNDPRYPACHLGEGVEWIRRMPLTGEGFAIRIEDSPTQEV